MNEQSDLHLPPPSFEPGQPMEYQPNNSPERVPNPELFPSSNITSASNVGLASALPLIPGAQLTTAKPTTGVTALNVNNPVQPNNQHLETQYVERAKKIIATTKGDPYVRTKEMNKNKAEFLDRKYSKKIKVSDE
ncbi:MAG TPA: hypothetical protein VMR08_02410 [Patescibacteria group bacterium]|jgi:hypothetical protein|nr:hypothetical protein [Patescibacteria group bacterium]